MPPGVGVGVPGVGVESVGLVELAVGIEIVVSKVGTVPGRNQSVVVTPSG